MVERITSVDIPLHRSWEKLRTNLMANPPLERFTSIFHTYQRQIRATQTFQDCGPSVLMAGFRWTIEKMDEYAPGNPFNPPNEKIADPMHQETIIINPDTTFRDLVYHFSSPYPVQWFNVIDQNLGQANISTLIGLVKLGELFTRWRSDPHLKDPNIIEMIKKNIPIIDKMMVSDLTDKHIHFLYRSTLVAEFLGKKVGLKFAKLIPPPDICIPARVSKDMLSSTPILEPTKRYSLAEISEIRRKLARETNPRTR